MMKNAKPVYVIGHRNPDTDSICSAIAYAALKQKEGENAIAARAGQINSETQYALDYFKAEVPTLIVDLYPRVRDIMLDCTAVVAARFGRNVIRQFERHAISVFDVVSA